MDWTTDRPTTPGFYWVRNYRDTVMVVWVVYGQWGKQQGRLLVMEPGSEDTPLPVESKDYVAWAGPIEPPRS